VVTISKYKESERVSMAAALGEARGEWRVAAGRVGGGEGPAEMEI
jgi:hypothetical protein